MYNYASVPPPLPGMCSADEVCYCYNCRRRRQRVHHPVHLLASPIVHTRWRTGGATCLMYTVQMRSQIHDQRRENEITLAMRSGKNRSNWHQNNLWVEMFSRVSMYAYRLLLTCNNIMWKQKHTWHKLFRQKFSSKISLTGHLGEYEKEAEWFGNHPTKLIFITPPLSYFNSSCCKSPNMPTPFTIEFCHYHLSPPHFYFSPVV